MTRPVEQLTLNGAMALLSYLQCSHLSPAHIKAAAIAATLCEMLSQLETEFPGITHEYGWEKIVELPHRTVSSADREVFLGLESDRRLHT